MEGEISTDAVIQRINDIIAAGKKEGRDIRKYETMDGRPGTIEETKNAVIVNILGERKKPSASNDEGIVANSVKQ